MGFSPLDLIIWDVDGTLVDSRSLIVDTMAGAFVRAELTPPTADETGSIIGLSLIEGIARLLPDGEKHRAPELEGLYRQIYFETRSKPDFSEHMFEGMAALLDELTAHEIPMAIATGKSRRGAVSFLERFGLEGRFVCVRTPDDGPGKPNPWMIHEAVDAIGADPERTVMIGDATYDIDMAVNAGITGLGVAWGNHPSAVLIEAGAVAVAKDASELRLLLQTAPWLASS